MLVILRRRGEGARIGDEIFVKVLEIGRKRVKLGIEAPSDVAITRDELLMVQEHAQEEMSDAQA